MPIEVLMPALSPTMTEGNLAKWHVKEGDEVNPGDVIAEIETDKATMEVESVDEGVVGKILVPEGSEAVQVNQTIGVLLEEGEDASAIVDEAESAASAHAPKVEEPAAVAAASAPAAGTPGSADVKASPLAKRIAEQTGVDLGSVSGSGAHGKIVKADVEAAMSGGAIGARMTGGGFGGAAIALVARDTLTAVTDAVTAAFSTSGFRAPRIFTVQPSAGAHRDS